MNENIRIKVFRDGRAGYYIIPADDSEAKRRVWQELFSAQDDAKERDDA